MNVSPTTPKAKLTRIVKTVWRLLPRGLRLVFWKHIGNNVRNYVDLKRVARPQQAILDNTQNLPLVVAGLFRTANGIGEAARSTYASLQAAGLNPIAVDLSEQLAHVDLDIDIPLQPMPDEDIGILILQFNGPETIPALKQLGMTRGRKWYMIGYWAWELPVFPQGWEAAFPFLSEIWTVSDFSSKAIAQHESAPGISVFGHAVQAPSNLTQNRVKYGLPEDAFIFLVMADSMSSLTRKNPFLAIEAHKKAFADDPKKVMVIKIKNLEFSPKAHHDLLAAVDKAENIILLAQSLNVFDKWELLNSADCLISLHRSEGYGLVVAEAMALGKPVIVTNWSGSTDFTNEKNSVLADYSLVDCDDQYDVYKNKDAKWADVSIDEAVKAMKSVVDNQDLRTKISNQAAQDIKTLSSPQKIGGKMAEKITQIKSNMSET